MPASKRTARQTSLSDQITAARQQVAGNYRAQVIGSKGDRYTVQRDHLGRWTCDCPAFTKWRRGLECKHIAAVKPEEEHSDGET